MSTRAAILLPLPYHASKPQAPRKTLQHEACQAFPNSAPSSPTGETHRIRAEYGHPSQPQSARIDKTFLGDATLTDNMRDQDDGDPHDLSLPTKHIPRASMVDNMVMSLDHFSPSTDTSRNHALRNSRPRGHTKSSSVTTSSEIRGNAVKEIPAVEIKPAKDGAKVQQVEQVSNGLGDEEEESQRDKAYNAQRAMQSGKTGLGRGNPGTRNRSGSNSSSIDLGHLAAYAGRLGAAGNRRSQSFDFGSVRPKHLIDQGAAVATPTYQEMENTTPSVKMATTAQTSKSNNSRKGRSGTIGAANSRSRLESPQPQLSTKSQTFDASDVKPSPMAQTDQSQTPKAGFFRRVFGSSNRSSMAPSSYPSPARQSHERNSSAMDVRRPGTPPMKTQKSTTADTPQSKENQPVITKKPSSFFRRRKKSVNGGVPPPLPLVLNGNLDNTKLGGGESSPVSSLRAFMDPYLGDGLPKHARGSSLQSVQNVDGETTVSKAANTNTSAKIEKVDTSLDVKLPYKESPRKKDTANTQHMMTSSTPKDEGAVELDNNTAASVAGSHFTQQENTAHPSSPSQIRDIQSPSKKLNIETPTQAAKSASSIPSPLISSSSQDKENSSPTKSKREDAQTEQEVRSSVKMIKLVPKSSGSDISDYKSAPSTPLVAEIPERVASKSPAVHISHPSISQEHATEEMIRASKIYNNTDEMVNSSDASAWLGEASDDRQRLRTAYMSLFDWKNLTILAALRNLCSKLVLKGETQQVDRILDAFAQRWCECNSDHGFKSADVVHTICYSILLLNTDLHLADIGRKMTKAEFVRNAVDTIRENMPGTGAKQAGPTSLLAVRKNSYAGAGIGRGSSVDRAASAMSNTRPTEHLSREESYDEMNTGFSGPLVEAPFHGSQSEWEFQIELILKDFYSSISREPLPLFGSQQANKVGAPQSSNNLAALSSLRRTPSTLSKATSENRGRYVGESRSLGARWASKTRSRARLGAGSAFGSSRTSIDDQSSAWSPSMSSTWSRVSLNKTLTSMSVESFGPEHLSGGYQSSIGFANALSQAIIRDEQMDAQVDDGIKAVPLLEDESLELYGAPWAKEGILKHKCHLEGVDKRSKDRNWNDCFAVIEKGWMRLFSFSMTAKSLRNKARNQKSGGVVGGGNWQDNAEEVWKFMLRHTIASSLPPPGYSKQRPYVWALSLPNGAVHLFSVGTPDIVKEFVSTANFWSARLSKEPMTGGISSMEYGWSDSVINRSLVSSDSHPGFNTGSPRPSTQLSMRSSMDHGNMRPRLPGDKAHITEWVPPQQSLMASQLLEIDQLKALQAYVKNIEDELQKHNEYRGPMLLAFSARHPNSQKAMMNWEKKSSYLLREIVKFRTYIDTLQSAQSTKEKVDKLRKEQELSQRDETDAGQALAATS